MISIAKAGTAVRNSSRTLKTCFYLTSGQTISPSCRINIIGRVKSPVLDRDFTVTHRKGGDYGGTQLYLPQKYNLDEIAEALEGN